MSGEGASLVYAIIEDSGTQIKVSSGDVIDIDLRRELESMRPGTTLTFDRVLAVGEGGETAAKIGTPYLDGATVSAEVVDAFLDRKIDVMKYKRRKGYKLKQGHRQGYVRVRIGAIAG